MITVNYLTKIIFIPQTFLTFVTGTIFDLSILDLWLALADIQDDEEGMPFDTMYIRVADIDVVGLTIPGSLLLINGYSIEFEDGQYTVRLFGANTNIFDVEDDKLIQNQVQVIATNLGALQDPKIAIDTDLNVRLLLKILQNRFITNPVDGVATLFDDDDATPLLAAQLYEDAAGTRPYRGKGAERRERLQ